MEKFELMQLSKPVMSHLSFKLYIKKKSMCGDATIQKVQIMQLGWAAEQPTTLSS